MFRDWNFWFTSLTAVIALIALWQTHRQIKLSNKQQLFDRRVDVYLRAKGLINLFESNEQIWQGIREDKPCFSNNLNFLWLTNNEYLETITGAIYHPLENPDHKAFLSKREDLKRTVEEIKLIVSGQEAILLSEFVLCYEAYLFAMYQYQIILDHMDKNNKEHPETLEYHQNLVNEPEHRKDLEAALDNLTAAYQKIKEEKVMEKIEKQIKLV